MGLRGSPAQPQSRESCVIAACCVLQTTPGAVQLCALDASDLAVIGLLTSPADP
jgi:hypothetical protein